MPRIPRPPLRWVVAVVVVAVLAAGGIALSTALDQPASVRTSESVITVHDGPARDQAVDLDTTLYLPERTPAPAVLLAHGFGGSKRSVDSDARELAQNGFVVLAWSARGFGRSGGTIALNSPDYEVADASQLVDWLAARPEVRLDGPGDPVVGVTGSSYGGALSVLLAGTDQRVDALAPVITYNDLSQALLPNAAATVDPASGTPAAGAFQPDGVFKRSWAGIFFAAGLGGGGEAGGAGAEAPEPGSQDTSGSSGGTDGAAAAAPVQTDLGGGGGGCAVRRAVRAVRGVGVPGVRAGRDRGQGRSEDRRPAAVGLADVGRRQDHQADPARAG